MCLVLLPQCPEEPKKRVLKFTDSGNSSEKKQPRVDEGDEQVAS